MSELTTNFRTLYNEQLQAAKPLFRRLVTTVPSTAVIENYGWLTSLPGMKKLLGSAVVEKLEASKYSIENFEWEDTISVKELHIVTDQYGIYSPKFSALGRVAAYHPDELVAEVMMKGFTENDYTGTPFFSENKKRTAKDKAPFTNVTNKKFSVENYEKALANMKLRKNSEGRNLGLGANLMLVVTAHDEKLARQILNADLVNQGESNVLKGSAELMVFSQLTSFTKNATDAPWFLLDLGQPVGPFIYQYVREPVLTASDDPKSEHMVMRHEALYQAYGIYNIGYGMCDFAYGSTGTAAA